LADTAFAFLDKSQIREDAQNGNRRAIRINRIALNEPSFFQSTMRMANLLTWAAFAALIITLPLRLEIVIGVMAGGAIFALLICNILKAVAISNPNPIAGAVLLPLRLFLFFLSPIMRVITVISDAILHRVGIDANRADFGVSEDDIRNIVNRGGDVGSIDAAEQEMINNIFEFNDKSAADIATHRTDMVAIDVNASREEIINTFIESDFTRYPVYEEDMDDIIGILNVKDILTHIFTSKDLKDDLNPREFMKEPYKIPSSKKIDSIFEEMRKSKTHMAIVFDEYGGCEGILTMEDLVEEIVGNIYDEYDEIEAPDVHKMGDNKYMIQGLAEPEDVARVLGIILPKDEEYDTFGGFLVHLLDRIPNDGEKDVSVNYNGYLFKVYEVKEKRIVSVFAEKEVQKSQEE